MESKKILIIYKRCIDPTIIIPKFANSSFDFGLFFGTFNFNL